MRRYALGLVFMMVSLGAGEATPPAEKTEPAAEKFEFTAYLPDGTQKKDTEPLRDELPGHITWQFGEGIVHYYWSGEHLGSNEKGFEALLAKVRAQPAGTKALYLTREEKAKVPFEFSKLLQAFKDTKLELREVLGSWCTCG